MPKVETTRDEIPLDLRPYIFHGLDLDQQGAEAIGTCPWCGGEKFSVQIKKGFWKCWSCNEGASEKGGGNVSSFLSHLHEVSFAATDPVAYVGLAQERGLNQVDALIEWGFAKSIITGEWIVPFYGKDKKVKNLSAYRYIGGKYRMQSTSGLKQSIPGGLGYFSPRKATTYLVEGLWDALVLWEVLSNHNEEGEVTHNRKSSLLSSTNILVLPGCNSFKEEWVKYVKGQDVLILFDNDHPKYNKKLKKDIPAPAFEGVKRTAKMLAKGKTNFIGYLNWGDEVYHDPELESGTDLRDLFGGKTVEERNIILKERILEKVIAVDEDWVKGVSTETATADLIDCDEWKVLINQWRKAMMWTEGLNRGLAVMLASVASTKLMGDQLWVKIIGPPACGKSTLAEAISSAPEYIKAISTLTGFHSGYGDGTEDNSLINQINGKTLIIKDGDTLLQQANLGQILSEARDIYDTVSRTYYRNKASRDYVGIRMTWILCGTSSLRALDQSELGARFLDCVLMDKIDDDLEDQISLRVAYKAERNLSIDSDTNMETQQDETMTRAIHMTGGYVHYLRENAPELMSKTIAPDWTIRRCARLGKFIAFMRARPSLTQKETAEREFSTRLTSQFVRLAKCLAVVLNKKELDGEVMDLVKSVALDTGRGIALDLCKKLHEEGGLEVKALSMYLATAPSEVSHLLRFMKKIDALEQYRESKDGVKGPIKWRMIRSMRNLYEEIMEN